jgi:hypothetical protein
MALVWKLIPTVLLAAAVVAGLTARPPRTPVTPRELVRLVLSVVGLYLVGGIALLAHRTPLAAIAFGAGLALCALAVWLCRGGTPPPPEPEADPELPDPPLWPIDFDWSFYEEQLRQSSPPEPREPSSGPRETSEPR